MNQIRAIQALNKKEIENGISPDASWHVDYRDTAYVYVGGLPFELTEGDVITIFSQFGEPVFLKLVRDKETGKSKGFGWLKYEDQRSTDLAVDNLGGAEIGGRLIRVDHARYKARDDEDVEEFKVGWEDIMRKEGQRVPEDESSGEEDRQPALPEERELARLIQHHDDDDPMKAFLIERKKEEADAARRNADAKDEIHKHRRHRKHHSRREDGDGDKHSSSHRDGTTEHRDRRHKDGDGCSKRHRDRHGSRERDRNIAREKYDDHDSEYYDLKLRQETERTRRHDETEELHDSQPARRQHGGSRRRRWESRSRSPRRRDAS